MWGELIARAANENGIPDITDPWPVKDVGLLVQRMGILYVG